MAVKTIQVMQASVGTSPRTGRPVAVLNAGEAFVPMGLLINKGVFHPGSLIGKQVTIDFFDAGDQLLNGNPVTQDYKIVRGIIMEADTRVFEQINVTLGLEQARGWNAAVAESHLRNQALRRQQMGAGQNVAGDATGATPTGTATGNASVLPTGAQVSAASSIAGVTPDANQGQKSQSEALGAEDELADLTNAALGSKPTI